MSSEYLLPLEQLQQMDDLSAANLYRAEVQQIPFLSRQQQAEYVSAAQAGDTDATHALVLNCLNWTMWRARAIHRDCGPEHTDVMDLVGTANLRMLETIPNALNADDPVAYLMTVASSAMRWHVTYRDSLVTRKRDQPLTREHPYTLSLEDWDQPVTEAVPGNQDCQFVYEALATLSRRHQIVLECAYGLRGHGPMKNEDIALMLNVSKGTVEKYLWRAKRRLAEKLGPYMQEKGLDGE